MKTTKRFTVGLAMAALMGTGLAACGDDGGSGTITQKEHSGSSSERTCTGSGTNKKCKTKRKAEKWVLELSDGGHCDVSRTQWDAAVVGQQYHC